MKILGIDEAGRGSVLGPLCIAGVVTSSDSDIQFLQDIGCTDSKKFGAGQKAIAKRAEIAEKIQSRCPHYVYAISSQDVDKAVEKNGLNDLERKFALKIINHLEHDKAILDGKKIFGGIARPNSEAYNRADTLFIQVAAASILAKNKRDELFAECMRTEKLPFDGWGYPNKATKRILQNFHSECGRLPDFYRYSYKWEPLKNC